jgi:hypothetical protein
LAIGLPAISAESNTISLLSLFCSATVSTWFEQPPKMQAEAGGALTAKLFF